MKINEIEPYVYREIAETYNINEEQLDEVIPAIAAIAGGVARAALGGAAKSVGRAALGGAAKAALGGRAGGSMSSSRSAASTRRSPSSYRKTNNPNATIGSQDDSNTSDTTGTTPTKPNIQQRTTNSKFGAGKMIKLPTQTAMGKIGPPKNFKVKQVKGDEVEIINPMPKPGEPKRFVFNKNELGSIIDET